MKTLRKISTVIMVILPLLTILVGLPLANAQTEAHLTGTILDSGVDTDGNGKFDYLKIGVEVEVYVPGDFRIYVSGLLTSEGNYIPVYDYAYASLNVGKHVVDVNLYGPTIYDSHLNPAKVSWIMLSSLSYAVPLPFLPPPSSPPTDTRSDVSLSRVYSYTEFDQPFHDMEAKFVVYPNGTVRLAGSSHLKHMVPQNAGPLIDGVMGISGADGLTRLWTNYTVGIPPRDASIFPYNATVASMLSEFSNEHANMELSAAVNMAPEVAAQYPFNTTDFWLTASYSNNVVNAQISCNTTLPKFFDSIFLLNITDFSVDGQFSNNEFSGVITLHVLPNFPLGNVDIDFHGNKTYLELKDSVRVIYGQYWLPGGQYIEVNETMLNHLLQFISVNLTGRGPQSIYNMTMGTLELTSFEWTKTPFNGIGAIVEYTATFKGDFIKLIALMASNGKNTLMYSPIDAMLSSAQTVNFKAAYTHATRQLSLRVSLTYSLRSLLDFFLKPPSNIKFYLIGGYSMSPTLERGDIILVENITNPANVKANPVDGDILVFHHPTNLSLTVVSRAIYKSNVGGVWYYQTKGDNNPTPDPWTGPETWNGMISDRLLIGNVTGRIPFIGVPIVGLAAPEEVFEVANKTFAAIKSGSLTLTYSKTSKKLEFTSTLTWNPEEYRNATVPFLIKLLERMPPPYGTSSEMMFLVGLVFKYMQNNTICKLHSSREYAHYENGKTEVEASYYLEGDLNAEINALKNYVVDKSPEPLSWQADILKNTSIDISKLRANFTLNDSSQKISFDGINVTPPKTMKNATCFQLERFFNLTADVDEPPHSNERLKIIVEGGSNITHGVTIIVPNTVPQRDIIESSFRRVIWNNQTISSLKDLVFKIKTEAYIVKILVLDLGNNPLPNADVNVRWPNGTLCQSLKTNDFGYTNSFIIDYSLMPFGTYNTTATYQGVSATEPLLFAYNGSYIIKVAINGPQVVHEITTVPYTIDAIEKAGCKLIVNQISKPATIAVRNVTLPSGVNPPPSSYKLLGCYVEIFCNETDVSPLNITLFFYYTPEQLSQLGLDENSLTIYYWDAAKGKWVDVPTKVNKEEHYVWANVDHLSIWALLGKPSSLWEQPWFWALIIGVILVALIVATAVYMIKKKKPKQSTQPMKPSEANP
jgi:signal peptidase I